jgi:DNA polymerase elongation subunit (family B)
MLFNIKVYSLDGELVHRFFNMSVDETEDLYVIYTTDNFTVKITTQEPFYTLINQVDRIK